jgi:protocatechuate 3,4-dioxygenase beta subunit
LILGVQIGATVKPDWSSRRFLFSAIVLSSSVLAAASWPPPTTQLPAGLVSGVVLLGSTDQPAAFAEVRMLREGTNPNGTLTTKASADGRFTIPASLVLHDGRYEMSAMLAGYGTGTFGSRPGESNPVAVRSNNPVANVTIRIYKYGSLSGRVIDAAGHPIPNAVVGSFAREFVYGQTHFLGRNTARSGDDGTFKITPVVAGDYVIGAWVGIPVGTPSVVANTIYRQPATTFFPNAESESTATIVHVGLEEDRAQLEIQLRARPAGQVEGTVVGDVPPLPATVWLRSESSLLMPMPRSAPTDDAGRFAFRDIQPGRYVLLVRPDLQGDGPRVWARQPLVVGASNGGQARLELHRGVTITGNVRAAGTGGDVPTLPAGVHVRIVPAASGYSEQAAGSIGVDDHGRFSVSGVAPGRYVLQAVGLPSGWVTVDSDADEGRVVEASDRDVAGIVLSVTNRPPERSRLTGALRDSSGQLTDDGTIIVYPSDRHRWDSTTPDGAARTTRPDNEGNFELTGLPPTEYLIAVVQTLDRARVSDPAFLATLAPVAKVSLADGEEHRLDLRVPR